jgi:hypothetical protein
LKGFWKIFDGRSQDVGRVFEGCLEGFEGSWDDFLKGPCSIPWTGLFLCLMLWIKAIGKSQTALQFLIATQNIERARNYSHQNVCSGTVG